MVHKEKTFIKTGFLKLYQFSLIEVSKKRVNRSSFQPPPNNFIATYNWDNSHSWTILHVGHQYTRPLHNYILYIYTSTYISIFSMNKVKLVWVESTLSCYNFTILEPILKFFVPLFLSLNAPLDDTFTVR